MAIEAMDQITLYGTKKERKKILEALQRFGVVEIREVEADGFEHPDTSKMRSTFERNLTVIEDAIGILDRYAPKQAGLLDGLKGRKHLSKTEYDAFLCKTEDSFSVAKTILRLEKEKTDIQAEILRRETQIDALQPWRSLDVPMTFSGTKQTAAFIGVLPNDQTAEMILSAFQSNFAGMEEEEIPSLDLHIISRSQEQTCILALCHRSKKEAVEQGLRSIGFSKPAYDTSLVPLARIERNQTKIKEQKEKILEIEEKLSAYGDRRTDLEFLYDYYKMRTEKYEVLEKIGQSARVFVLQGYLPHKLSDEFIADLTLNYEAAVDVTPATDDDTPVLLKNNGFSAPVENVLESYSLPGPGDIDPTTVMSIFYYVLFGLMLSDAIYGLLMVVGCAFALRKFPGMEDGLKKSLKMFFYCGISTVFWGVMFGSYLGDFVDVVSTTFFHKTVSIPPLWFTPSNDPMRMLMFSMALGIVHIFGGLAMKLWMCLKEKDYVSAFFDVVCWYFLVGGGVVYLLTVPMFLNIAGLTLSLPGYVQKIALVLICIGVLGIVFFSGRRSKNPAKRVAMGLYDLYGATSYLSDVLSYSRLLALGLATGVIAQVFNKMGSMFGDGVLGIILFAIVCLIGHSLNMAINLLGAYVHTNRLQFVEFFGKFYEGGGRKYKPFAANTKYYKFKEEL